MKKLISILILTILCKTVVFGQKLWNQKADFPGTARNNAAGFAINGKGYIGLGQNPSGTKQTDFYEYDPATNKWASKANYPGAGIAGSIGFTANGRGYVCFGVNSSGTSQKELWEYTPTSNTWAQKASCPGAARFQSGCFVINDTAFIIGGNPGSTPYCSDVWMYIASTNTWTQKSNFPAGTRAGGTGFTVNGTGYFGTGITNSTTTKKDVWKYNKSKDTWTSIADAPASFSGAVGFGIGDKGYLGTGYDLTNFLKDIYEYNPTADAWTKVDSIPASQSVRGFSVSFIINGSGYFGTGYGTSVSTSVYDFWSLTPKTISLPCNAMIISEPKNQQINLNNTAKFSIITKDTNISYKWQLYSAGTFSDIFNVGQYSGAKTRQLNVSNVKFAGNNNQKFRCISTSSTCSDTSIEVILNVICTPLVNNEPSNINASNGSDVKFSISTLIAGSTLQWQKNDGSGFKDLINTSQYLGFDMDTLKVLNLSISNNNSQFRCMVSFGGCRDTSLAANLSVYCKPILRISPSNKTVFNGNNVKFGVGIYDFGTTYQWQTKIGSSFQNLSNSGQFSGVNTDSLSISPANVLNKKQEFRCIVSYKSCSDTTKIVTLDVKCNPMVNSHPVNKTGVEGTNATFSVSSFDSKALYFWQSNIGFGFQNLNNVGQYSGVNSANLNISNLTFSNDNQQFRCVLSSDGCFDTSKTVLLKVTCKPLIIKQPLNKTESVSDTTFFYVTSGDPKATFLWQSNIGFGFQNLSTAGQYSGATNDTLIVYDLLMTNNRQYFRCLVNNEICKDTTETAILRINPIGGINEIHKAENFKIYPNPVSNILNVETLGIGIEYNISLYNLNGHLLMEQKIIDGKSEIDLSNLSKGVYYLKCVTDNAVEVRKVIKE